MNRLVATALLVGSATNAGALTPPPKQPFEARTWSASMPKAPMNGFKLGGFKVSLEKTTLAEIMNHVSAGRISRQGDAGESGYWICYTVAQAGTAARVWIVSHGEMGGQNHAVTGIVVQRLASDKPTRDCPSLPQRQTPISLGVPIWVGSTDGELSQALGAPSYQRAAWKSYDFKGKVPGRCDGGFDLLNWLLVKSERGAVELIHAGQVTSC